MINLSDLEIKILNNQTDKLILKNALKRCMLSDNYISLIDSKSLINFICDLYKIDHKEFDDMLLINMVQLGHKIIKD
jgi:hypothetical protein